MAIADDYPDVEVLVGQLRRLLQAAGALKLSDPRRILALLPIQWHPHRTHGTDPQFMVTIGTPLMLTLFLAFVIAALAVAFRMPEILARRS